MPGSTDDNFAATQQFRRFRSEADIQQAALSDAGCRGDRAAPTPAQNAGQQQLRPSLDRGGAPFAEYADGQPELTRDH
jgi:hypothetical protein